MGRLAAGLRRLLLTVRVGLTEPRSNGPVEEGFVHELKPPKRRGYSRAGFDPLRGRALAA